MRPAKKIFQALLWGQFGFMFRSVVCLFIGILIARWMDVSDFGLYASFLACLHLMITFTGLGESSIFNNFIPRYRETHGPEECSYLVRRVILYKFALHLVFALLIYRFGESVFLAFDFPGLHEYTRLLAAALLVRGTMNSFNFATVSLMKMRLYTLVEVGVTLFQLAGVLVLKWVGFGVGDIIVLIITVNALQLLGFSFGTRDFIQTPPARIPMTPVFRFGVVVWLTTLGQTLMNKYLYSLMILYYLKMPEEVAFYDVAHLLCFKAGFALLVSMNLLELPIMSGAYARGGMEGLQVYWRVVYKSMVIASLPVLVFVGLYADEFVEVLYTSKYSRAGGLLFVLSMFCAVGILFGQRMAGGVLYPLGKEKTVFAIRGSVAVLNVILGLILIPRMGIEGAVWGTGISYAVGNAVECSTVLRILRARPPWKFLACTAGSVALAAFPLIWFSPGNLLALAGLGCVYMTLVVWLIFSLSPFEEDELNVLKDLRPKAYAWFGNFTAAQRRWIPRLARQWQSFFVNKRS